MASFMENSTGREAGGNGTLRKRLSRDIYLPGSLKNLLSGEEINTDRCHNEI